ncbi:MAG: hypothetical protein LBK66_07585 [Spirochaetaceae bacterium]|jgi:hypothetical protein|nr:hypothetical protein [Spirochaetaceae bacterium]
MANGGAGRYLFSFIFLCYYTLMMTLMKKKAFTPGSFLRLEANPNADWREAFPLKPGEQVRPLYGLFESDGHELDRFLAEKRREKALEDMIEEREAAESERLG